MSELDGNDDALRTCAWSLDLSGSDDGWQGAGGIGGLVFEYLSKTESTHHVYYDGNGNVTSLRDNAGPVSAGYDYGPFGISLDAVLVFSHEIVRSVYTEDDNFVSTIR